MPPHPVGTAIHWPGTTTTIGHRPQANMAARLEGYRRFHVYGRGWTDIAYQVAIDQDGRVWDLRGIEHESAANGDQSVNLTYLACLFLIGPGETPGPELLAAFADWHKKALSRYPTAKKIVGHQDIRPDGGTDCPGPITERLIKAGTLLEEDDVSAADVWSTKIDRPNNTPISAGTSLSWANYYAYQAAKAAEATLAQTAALAAALQAALKNGTGSLDLAAVQAAAQKGAEAALKEAAAAVAES